MSKLAEFREKYPMYNDLSDEDLANRLYDKYYANSMSRSDYYGKLGLQPNEQDSQTGVRGIVRDVMRHSGEFVKGLPAGIAHVASAIPETAIDSFKMMLDNPADIFPELGYGGYLAAQGLSNIPSNTAEYLASKGIISPETAHNMFPRGSMEPIGNLFSEERRTAEPRPAAKALRAAPELLATILAPELGALKPLSPVAARGIGGATLAASHEQDPLLGALLAMPGPRGYQQGAQAVGRGVVEGAKNVPGAVVDKAFDLAVPTPTISANQIRRNELAAQGTMTPMGRIIGSPSMSKFEENILPYVPFNNASEHVYGVRDKINQGLSELLEDLPSDISGNPSLGLQEALKNKFEKVQGIKEDKYRPVNEQAAMEGFQADLSGANSPKLAGSLKSVKSSSEYRTNDQLKSVIDFILEKPPEIQQVRNPYTGEISYVLEDTRKFPEMVDIRMAMNRLHKLSDQYRKSPDALQRSRATHFRNVENAIRKQLNDQIKKHGSRELNVLSEEANRYYGDEFSKYLNKDIYKYIVDETPAENLVHQVVTSSPKLGRGHPIKEFNEAIGEENRGALAKGYLEHNAYNNANELQANAVLNNYNKLSNQQKEALFNPQQRAKADLLSELLQINPKAAHPMLNPETGAWSKFMLTYGALTHPPLLGASLATNKIFNSPKIRKKVIDTAVKKAKKREQKAMEKKLNTGEGK